MDLESVREKYRFIDTQSQAELEFLYDKQFLKEGVLDVKSVEGLPSELAIQYATNVTKIGVSNEHMVHAREINVKMQDTLVMIKEWEAQGEDTTPLVALYNEFARLSAIALVEGVKGLPLSARLVALNLSIFDNQKAVCLGELDYRSAGDGAFRNSGFNIRGHRFRDPNTGSDFLGRYFGFESGQSETAQAASVPYMGRGHLQNRTNESGYC
jgi:hypothetical protein